MFDDQRGFRPVDGAPGRHRATVGRADTGFLESIIPAAAKYSGRSTLKVEIRVDDAGRVQQLDVLFGPVRTVLELASVGDADPATPPDTADEARRIVDNTGIMFGLCDGARGAGAERAMRDDPQIRRVVRLTPSTAGTAGALFAFVQREDDTNSVFARHENRTGLCEASLVDSAKIRP